ncbi:MAG: TonB family protein [Deltaproteobacteria bacterium]|nr:TonB family protein [Deltaproteobacteria bacterium]
MPDGRRRERDERRSAEGSFLRGTLLSAILHALAIGFMLLAPQRMRAAPPTAYTVEIVDPNALGGKLLAGPIGGGAASRHAAPPRPAPQPPPEPEEQRHEPEQVAKAAAPEPESPRDDLGAVVLPKATPAPQPTRVAPTGRPTPITRPAVKASPTPVVVARPKATASPAARANAKPTASPVALARRDAPPSAPSPAARGDASAKAHAGGDLDSELAAAIKGVESRVAKGGTTGLSAPGTGGGMGGTERTLNGPAGVGGEGPGGGGTLRGLEFVVYYNQMLTRIKESWTYVGERADLRVTIHFSILDSGEITDIRLVEGSGDSGYDASVERAVKRASPLAPPPQAYRKDFTDVELTFRPADLRRPSG